MGDLESTTETRLNSSLSSSRIPESWDEPRSHVKLVLDENGYHGMECCRVQADPDGMWLGQEQEQRARDGERQEQRKGQ